MNARSCPNKWQVEAAADGRLVGKDLHSLERHLTICGECAANARAITELGDALRRLPTIKPDRLSSQRLRQRIISDCNQAILAAPDRQRWRYMSAAIVFGIALLIAGWYGSSRQARNHATSVEVHARANTRWHEIHTGHTQQIELTDGEASFRIRRASASDRVVIAVPDGQIDDLGTVLTVRVREQITTLVSVQEGQVVVRLRGRPEIRLGAGESWTSSEQARAPEVARRSANEQDAAIRIPLATQVAPVARLHEQSLAPKNVPHDGTQQAHAAPHVPNVVSSKAAAGSSDDREDEFYLHIVALLQHGHQAEARAAAQAYLTRFPSGFRRVEVMQILAPPE